MPAYYETNGPLEDLSRACIDLAIKDVSPHPIDCQKAILLKFIKNSQALLNLAQPTRYKNEIHGSELLCETDTHARKMARKESTKLITFSCFGRISIIPVYPGATLGHESL